MPTPACVAAHSENNNDDFQHGQHLPILSWILKLVAFLELVCILSTSYGIGPIRSTGQLRAEYIVGLPYSIRFIDARTRLCIQNLKARNVDASEHVSCMLAACTNIPHLGFCSQEARPQDVPSDVNFVLVLAACRLRASRKTSVSSPPLLKAKVPYSPQMAS